MDYSKLSDIEINGKVARVTQKIGDFTQARGKTLIHDYEDVGEFKNICIGWKEFDPCNNPADAWPLLLSIIGFGVTVSIEVNSINGESLGGKSITRKIAELYLGLQSD